MTAFVPFRKILRLNRDVVITEKIDGTNASVLIAYMDAAWPLGAEMPFGWSDPLATVEGWDGEAPIINKYGLWAGKRTSWLNPADGKNWDNYGFGSWVLANAEELVALLGPGL